MNVCIERANSERERERMAAKYFHPTSLVANVFHSLLTPIVILDSIVWRFCVVGVFKRVCSLFSRLP